MLDIGYFCEIEEFSSVGWGWDLRLSGGIGVSVLVWGFRIFRGCVPLPLASPKMQEVYISAGEFVGEECKEKAIS
jgi:hypothetical protein